MADPVIVACPVDTWTLVATNQTTGVIHILKTDVDSYLQTYRMNGGGAPTLASEGVPFTELLQISAALGVDVYVWCRGKVGSVRVDL
jgi:hypothetical protein